MGNNFIFYSNMATTIDTTKYPYNLQKNDSRVFCLWVFIPMKLTPSAAFSFILWFDIILACCLFPIGSGYMYEEAFHGFKTMYGYGIVFWLMFIFSIYIMVLQCKWRKFLKSGTLSKHSKVWFYIRSVFWALISCLAIYGFLYHYELWDESQKDYNKSHKKNPQFVFLVDDTTRGIGSYSESITREVFYTMSMFVWAFSSCYAFT